MTYDPFPNVALERLLTDLRDDPSFQLVNGDFRTIAAWDFPRHAEVTSRSNVKHRSVENVLGLVRPFQVIDVAGGKADSGVGELPLGQRTIDGSLNRLGDRMVAKGAAAARIAWFSIESGLFRVAERGGILTPTDRSAEGVIQFTENADLSTVFDPEAEYEDRAVVAVRIPGFPTLVQVSPASEAVRFPKWAVHAARDAEGGFEQNTPGLILEAQGLVRDKQNPHVELTVDRPGGTLSRHDQIARAVLRALVRLSRLEYDGA